LSQAGEANQTVKSAQVGVSFRFTFLAFVAIGIVTLAIDIGLSVAISKPDPNVVNLIAAMDWSYKVSLGALIGLLGGKVTS
jgi:hypothetical protein